MRSHAKASTAGSTSGRRVSAGRYAFPLALSVALFCMGLSASSAFAAAPAIPTTTVSSVTTKAAVLEANINPEGEATSYRFEYGLADCASNPCASVPVPNAGAGSGTSAVRVQREVQGLTPGTTYHFRAVATNGSGTTNGPDRILTTYGIAEVSNCPNESFRTGPAANLADCRAYEMVSPIDKNGGDITTSCQITCYYTALNQASRNGDKFTYSSYKSFGDQTSATYSNQYLATRGANGWTTHGINAPQSTTIYDPLFEYLELDSHFFLFSEDLSSAWLRSFNKVKLPGTNGLDGYANLYRRDNLDGSFEALTVNAPVGPAQPSLGFQSEKILEVQGASSDGSHVIFSALAALTPDATTTEVPGVGTTPAQLYDFHNGQLELVSVLPGETANTGFSVLGGRNGLEARRDGGFFHHAVSDDGSRIFWSSAWTGEADSRIYVRIDGNTTIPVSPPKAQFWTAATDGSKALYSENEPGARALKEFDVDSETTTTIASNIYGVIGTSDDLSHIYFASQEVLDSGATAGAPNLYHYHNGTVTFISTVSPQDVGAANPFPYETSTVGPDAFRHTSRVTPDGLHAAFVSHARLTDYDNTDASNGEADMEVYIYDADSDELTCASCNPSGARPSGRPMQVSWEVGGRDVMDAISLKKQWSAAWLPTAENAIYTPRPLSADGSHLFFNAFDALVPGDNNGVQDVYEWRAQGVGNCQKGEGCISLISTGENEKKSAFVDASSDGSDVFFETESSIHPEDPGLIDIYNARVGGGYPYTPPSIPCEGDACQNIPAAPNDATPASANFKGAGDPKPRKARSRCRARNRKAAKGSSQKAKRKAAKRCSRAKGRAGR